ncbi:MMPL family transporter [Conexibacter woesei]|uniref:Drug exporter-like proteinr of the RND superfamily n=1 Tax=Conexibacter woesei (strain DSM 14684 / CCUG 47730 / CIP 108061 / JCM 11494 / NBRC 100937 / ID131577) TaxID=469383 RepID=D3FF35_CONWI|nr:MMPL family transporter [Conexibacter woesei]ADB51752.1 drug exporter-like proteinr of the RND superfamily [Conexibacter woesei DSM 14684]
MSSLLARIARALTHHWKRSLVAALLVVVALGIAAGAGGKAADDFAIPGTESQQALDLFKAHSPAFAGADSTLVFSVRSGRLTDPGNRRAVEGALAEVRSLDHVDQVADPFAAGGSISRDGRIAAVDVRYDIEATDVEKDDGEALEEAARSAESGGVDVAMRGIVVDLGQEQEAPVGELIGVAIAIVLLTLLFRSGAAMGATLVGALLGVVVGQILLTALAKPLGLPEFATTIAIMLGLGAGIDYALLIIGRYREQVAAGDSVRDASAKAAATSGASVVAAGLIVMVAIAGLLVIGIPMIGKMGVGAAIGIAAVVVSALTILPIMIGAFAKRLKPKKPEHVLPSKAFGRWGEIVTARPWLSIAAGVAILLVFAFPVTNMRLGQPDDGNQPTTRTQRIAYDQLSEAFGPGSNGPFLLAVDTPKGDAATRAQLARLETAVRALPGVAAVMPAALSEDGEMATITAIPRTAPQDAKTSDLLEQLRDDVVPGATAGTPLKVYIGGNTAGFEDFSSKVSSRLPLFIAVVIGLSVLLLMAAFRSLWIPLVSALFNLLSIGAAYGVVVAVFQEGIGAGLIGVDSGVPIVSFIPVMLFAILFGLSMDYNVFLLSRVHEAYNEGDAPRASVIHGVSRIGKVILFAGLIMASVFLAFVTQPDVVAKMMGLGLGLAILIDVLIVRLVIAPAVVTLLGDRAWWLPGWLDKLLPNVSLEGHLVQGVDEKTVAVGEEERERTPA